MLTLAPQRPAVAAQDMEGHAPPGDAALAQLLLALGA
jgi:hypothetical protein